MFKIDPDKQDFEFSYKLEAVGDGQRLAVSVRKLGRLMELSSRERDAVLRVRAYDDADECIWKEKVAMILPKTWIPGQCVYESVEIPGDMLRKVGRIKLRVEQKDLGYKEEVQLKR